MNANFKNNNPQEWVDLELSVKWNRTNFETKSIEDFENFDYEFLEEQIKQHKVECPTWEEWRELLENCDLKWTMQDGIQGCEFVSKKNGNTLFLPAKGENDSNDGRIFGQYWSSSVEDTFSAWSFYFDEEGFSLLKTIRDDKCSLRTVRRN